MKHMTYLEVQQSDASYRIELDDSKHIRQFITAAPNQDPTRGYQWTDQIITLMRTERQWVVIMPVGSQLYINGRPVIGLKVLADRQAIEYNGHQMTFHVGYQTEVLTTSSPEIVNRRRSPRSKLAFVIGQTIVRCPICGYAYSQDDWEEISTCTNPTGCTFTKPVGEIMVDATGLT